jgi:hypothetical protein
MSRNDSTGNNPTRELLSRLKRDVPLVREEIHRTMPIIHDGGLKACSERLTQQQRRLSQMKDGHDYASVYQERQKEIQHIETSLAWGDTELSIKTKIHGAGCQVATHFGLPALAHRLLSGG